MQATRKIPTTTCGLSRFRSLKKQKATRMDGVSARFVWLPDLDSNQDLRINSTDYRPSKQKNSKNFPLSVPAYYFGSKRACWKKGNARCVKADGTAFKGRACCSKVDKTFQKIEADLHNLTPAVGELNGDRSNLPYGIVKGEPREYGHCDFEIGGSPKVTEPRNEVRGDAARIWLYMTDTYGIPLTDTEREMFEAWSQADPPDRWEKLRDQRIEAAQGNHNEYVK